MGPRFLRRLMDLLQYSGYGGVQIRPTGRPTRWPLTRGASVVHWERRAGVMTFGKGGPMDLGLRDKVALVTAASKGLGRPPPWSWAARGRRGHCPRTAAEVESAAAKIRAATGARVLAVTADVSCEADLIRMAGEVTATYGRIDVLVNNAGGPPPGRFSEVSDEDWWRAVELTLLSAVRLTRLVLPNMRARRWGRVVNITSISVKQPIATLILSNALRSGVVAMAKTLAGEVAAEG